MAKRILITFLGIGQLDKSANADGRYRAAKYKIEDQYYETSFVASALAQHYKVDKLIFIGTMKSMWDEVYAHFSKKHIDEKYYESLFDLRQNSNSDTEPNSSFFVELERILGNHSKVIPVKYGLNVDELQFNLNQILQINNHLDDGDEVLIDITHSFRSLSVTVTTTLMYLRDVSSKHLKVSGLYYGMLDIIGELGYAPVVDLKYLDEMQQWIKGAFAFTNYGDINPLAALLPNETKFIEAANMFTLASQLNLTGEITSNANKVVSHLATIEFHKNHYKAFEAVKENIEAFPKKLYAKGNNWEAYLIIAKRNFDNQQFGMSILSAWEGVVARFTELYGQPADFKNYQVISKLVRDGNFYLHFKGTVFQDFNVKMKELSKFRNAIAHAEDFVTFTAKDVAQNFPPILTFLEKQLGSTLLNGIDRKIKYNDYNNAYKSK